MQQVNRQRYIIKDGANRIDNNDKEKGDTKQVFQGGGIDGYQEWVNRMLLVERITTEAST